MKKWWMIVFLFLIALPVWAGDEPLKIEEVVVTASKVEEPLEETTSGVIVITDKSIKAKNKEFVSDVFKDVPEINLIQKGGAGKEATIILRGGSSEHTMVMIDGVKVKSTTTGSFDFSGISVDDIERIEIVKGPQSTIYGSEAMAGVINIITKKGKGKHRLQTSLEAGSYGTYKPSVTLSGGDNRFDYRINGSYFYTDGISAARKGSERDGYKNASLSGKFGLRPVDRFELEIIGRYYYDRSELDAFGRDDLNYVQYGHHYLLSGKGTLYLTDTWEQILKVSRVEDSLKYRDPDTSYHNDDIITGMNTVEWQHNLYFSEVYTLTIGAEYREEEGENEGTFDRVVDNKAVYLNHKLKLLNSNLIINAGLRHDDHETFGSETTYRVGTVYNITPASLKIRASYGTGFRAPTLNELYYKDSWGSSGNPDLEPEKSYSWEIGIERELVKDNASVSIAYFDQRYRNLIEWIESPPGSWQYTPQNVSKAEVKGIEVGASVRVLENLKMNSAYTYLDTEDKDTGDRLTRRPIDKFNLSAEYSHGPMTTLLVYTYVGKARDRNKHLGSYSLLNLSGSYKLTEQCELFARIDNLLDEDYETAGGYNSPGFSVFGGIKFEM